MVAALCLIAFGGQSVWASQKSFAAARPAWSGWWWPFRMDLDWHLYDRADDATNTSGRKTEYQPLAKYAQLTGDWEPYNWERAKVADQQARWAGHCTGWASAALLYPEPTHAVTLTGGPWWAPFTVTFSPGEIKGLLAAAYDGWPFDDSAGSYHVTRNGQTWDYSNDLRAGDFHRFLLQYLGQGQGLVFNVPPADADTQIWNYPCDRVDLSWRADSQRPQLNYVTATLHLADDHLQDNGKTPDSLGRIEKTVVVKYWINSGDPNIDLFDPAQWQGATPSGFTAGWYNDKTNHKDYNSDHPTSVFAPTRSPAGGRPGWNSNLTAQYYQTLADLAARSAGPQP